MDNTLTTIVKPAVTIDEAKTAWTEYQNLKKAITEPSDIQIIENREFLKKSYWRKLATFFNLTTEILNERQESIGGDYAFHFTVKASAPNGRSAIGVGSCSAYEKASKTENGYTDRWGNPAKPNSIHNIRSTAETRATNRAISNLVGGGEVSADEIVSESEASQEEIYTAKPIEVDNRVVNPATPPMPPPSGENRVCRSCGKSKFFLDKSSATAKQPNSWYIKCLNCNTFYRYLKAEESNNV